jgi:acetoin utilization deacetylase AcuC-like enzyme
MATGIVWDERFAWHHTGNVLAGGPSAALEPLPHPDTPESKRRIRNLLEVSGLLTQLVPIAAESAGEDDLRRVHTRAHLDRVFRVSESGGGEVGSRTAIGSGGAAIATLAAGGGIAAVRAVCEGRVRNAYALLRPAGHHAESDKALGFCIFANAAIAGRYAQAQGLAERIAFVDWDVHHGNGTQEIFAARADVLYASVHQYPFYPGTGAAEEIGVGPGKGATVNCPLPGGQDDADYGAVFHDLFLPVGRAFAPDLVIVSAGFDAHARDPLAEMGVTERGFAAMASAMAELAASACGGKLVLLLEGGYDLAALAASVRATLEVLAGRREDFPLGAGTEPALAISATRDALRAGGRLVPKT